MKILQKKISGEKGIEITKDDRSLPSSYNLVLAFAERNILAITCLHSTLKTDFPNAHILINSTAGEITGIEVNENSVSVTAIEFEKTKIKAAVTHIDESECSYDAGKQLAGKIEPKGLKYVLVISDGHKVNGSELVLGLQENLPGNTIITGGLAGDGSRFQKTLVGLNERPIEGRIAAIAFYGEELLITYGSVGGWDPFGPERLITRSDKNILYELDNKPALDIYKMYLGDYANELPGSGLLFPLSIRTGEANDSLVRTILSVSEEDKSLTFAGNMPEGTYARLMKANLDRLIEGASDAAHNSLAAGSKPPELAILISCVGRKLVLDQRVEEEVEVVRAIYGGSTVMTGFYSYGEISPSFNFKKCELHNQTMTITTLSEG